MVRLVKERLYSKGEDIFKKDEKPVEKILEKHECDEKQAPEENEEDVSECNEEVEKIAEEKTYEGSCRCLSSGYVDNGNGTTTCKACKKTWDHVKFGAKGKSIVKESENVYSKILNKLK